MSKKSMELAIGTLVMIVLAALILVVLILGFTIGWNNLWNKILPYIGGNSGYNIDSVKNACDILCKAASVSPSTKSEYCTDTKTIIYGNNNKKQESCHNLKLELGLSCDVPC